MITRRRCLATFTAFIFVIIPGMAGAETFHSGLIATDELWAAEGNPHLLLDDVTIPSGVALAIGPGVEILAGPRPDGFDPDESFEPVIYVSGGGLSVKGTARDRISFSGSGGVLVFGGSASVSYADFLGGSRLYFDEAIGDVSSTTISGAHIALTLRDSAVSIFGSKFYDNDVGIRIEPHTPVLAGDVGREGSFGGRFGTGGIGDALALSDADKLEPSLTVRNSILENNAEGAVLNFATFVVDARRDWWGSPVGPIANGINKVQGPVESDPWLIVAPDFEETEEVAVCCSSVLFIPGLQGSRLYLPGNRLWEPNRNADLQKLALSASGSSADPGIYSGGPIDKALGVRSIYGKFMGFMDGLVSDGKVAEWRAFGYDWRKPVSGVVAGPEKKATTTEDLVSVVERLAVDSHTGQVSIVAHSNGGLVAKQLVKALDDTGKVGLIDSVVSVGVPYLGTPEAISGLLHGDEQSILGGLIASAASARVLGINMPSAYSLLPSREFFSRAFGPVITFASTTDRNINDGAYPMEISAFDDQRAFVLDAAGIRGNVRASDTDTPIRGNALLMGAAEMIHGILDPFHWPASIARWAIVGWNKETADGVMYVGRDDRQASVTSYGDGTVVAPSATYEGGQVVSADLETHSQVDNKDIEHANILESSSIQTAVEAIISNPAEQHTKVLEEIAQIPGMTIGELDWHALDAAEKASRKKLRISTHSPVDLHIYDSSGRHTGVISEPEGLDEEIEEGFLVFTEEGIPDSSLVIQGDGEARRTYITLPDDGQTYSAVVEGFGIGSFTLSLERIRATTTVDRVSWEDVPVTPLTVASTTFTGNDSFSVPQSGKLDFSVAALRLDLDGDGSAETVMKPGKVKDIGARLILIKRLLARLDKRIANRHVKLRELGLADRALARAFAESFRKRFENAAAVAPSRYLW